MSRLIGVGRQHYGGEDELHLGASVADVTQLVFGPPGFADRITSVVIGNVGGNEVEVESCQV